MKKSFTLIELIVVIAIIAVLAAVIAPNVFKAIEKAKVARAEADAKSIKTAIHALYADTGTWPGSGGSFWWYTLENNSPFPIARDSGLINNDDGWGGEIPQWDGPYLEKGAGITPWGGTYILFNFWLPGVGNFNRDMAIQWTSICYAGLPGSISWDCEIPIQAATRMNEHLDGDSTVFTGNFGISFFGYYWAVGEDIGG